MDMSLLSVTLILFLIMDPLGNISSFLSLVKGMDPNRLWKVVLREMLIALFFMYLFAFLGDLLLDVLKVSEITVRISSALILFLTAIKIIFPSTDSLRANLTPGEPFIVPLAIPLIAGPSLLATIMLFAHMEPNIGVLFASITIAWLCAMLILLGSRFLEKHLGSNGLIACERLMGMLLVMLAIQRFMEGIHKFVVVHCLT